MLVAALRPRILLGNKNGLLSKRMFASRPEVQTEQEGVLALILGKPGKLFYESNLKFLPRITIDDIRLITFRKLIH